METVENNTNEIIDLGFNVNEDELRRPVLKAGLYPFIIRATRAKTSKNGHPMLEVVYALAGVAEDTTGKPVNPGFTITQNYLREPTGNMTAEMVQRRFKEIHFAAAGEGAVNTGSWVGKTVNCRVSLREERTDENTGQTYPPSNEIARVSVAR